MEERVQKWIAAAGLASRRGAEDLIRAGLVTINGKKAKLGDRILPGKDAVKVDGKLIHTQAPKVYYAFHKPKCVLSIMGSDSEEKERPTLSSYLTRVKNRVFPLARLEYNAEGLMILTNDGALASKIEKSEQIVRVFEVKVGGHLSEENITALKKGTRLEGKKWVPLVARPIQRLTKKTKIEIAFQGMGSIDFKTYFARCGLLVEKVVQKSVGNLRLEKLPSGKLKTLRKTQVEALFKQPELGLSLLGDLTSDRENAS